MPRDAVNIKRQIPKPCGWLRQFQVYRASRSRQSRGIVEHRRRSDKARGKDGLLTVVNYVVARRDAQPAREIAEKIDPNAFITIDEARSLQRGYFRH